ncbi:GGDEF domain-containing protein [Acinetobacter kanungonis]|uniref:GGDEF domain-containing protein n=1 Tax=Acinetobacter kanungonis TaxID=2699469 RepID=UPI001F223173|nr:sensor domain-containing diguanylate cyclase [Acinetobacter kanungonis]
MTKKTFLPTMAWLQQKIKKILLEDGVIMNWNTLNKCILMLILGCLTHLIWMLWKFFVILNPALWNMANIELIKQQILGNFLFIMVLGGLIYPCLYWQHKAWVKRYVPYIAVWCFIISLCRDAYLIGVLSPATLSAYVSLFAVGLVLLPRTIVYSALIPATLYLFSCGYLSLQGVLPYAPVFNLPTYAYANSFWVGSMLYFIAPIVVICLILFEILLSQWRHREQLIQQLSKIDPLTNTYNRRSLNQYLERIHRRQHRHYALVLLDLDHFKFINDRHGHHKGDEALILVGQLLKQQLRSSDMVGRFGGEEFLLVLYHSTLEQAQHTAERCRAAIEQLELRDDVDCRIPLSASFGIATAQLPFTPFQLLTQADKALYAAKASGRNQVQVFRTSNDVKPEPEFRLAQSDRPLDN